LQLTGKIWLKLDSISSLLSEYGCHTCSSGLQRHKTKILIERVVFKCATFRSENAIVKKLEKCKHMK